MEKIRVAEFFRFFVVVVNSSSKNQKKKKKKSKNNYNQFIQHIYWKPKLPV